MNAVYFMNLLHLNSNSCFAKFYKYLIKLCSPDVAPDNHSHCNNPLSGSDRSCR